MIGERANSWFGRDRRYPAEYEPSGDDFLSGGLVEAALMRRVVDGCSFADWWHQFRPNQIDRQLAAAGKRQRRERSEDRPSARTELVARVVLATALPELDTELKALARSVDRAASGASVQAATHGAYVGTHWLASFAVLALT